MPFNILSPAQLKKQVARQAKQKRLEKNLSRATVSLKTNIPVSTLKRFETTGNISFDALLRLALVLDCLNEFAQLFVAPPTNLLRENSTRQRGRE